MNIVKQKNRHRENGGSFLVVFIFLGWMSHILELNSGVKLSSPSQKWRAFPQTSAERFTFLPAFESNVPFLGAMSHILELNSGSQD